MKIPKCKTSNFPNVIPSGILKELEFVGSAAERLTFSLVTSVAKHVNKRNPFWVVSGGRRGIRAGVSFEQEGVEQKFFDGTIRSRLRTVNWEFGKFKFGQGEVGRVQQKLSAKFIFFYVKGNFKQTYLFGM